jgi:chromosome segregation ATPase
MLLLKVEIPDYHSHDIRVDEILPKEINDWLKYHDCEKESALKDAHDRVKTLEKEIKDCMARHKESREEISRLSHDLLKSEAEQEASRFEHEKLKALEFGVNSLEEGLRLYIDESANSYVELPKMKNECQNLREKALFLEENRASQIKDYQAELSRREDDERTIKRAFAAVQRELQLCRAKSWKWKILFVSHQTKQKNTKRSGKTRKSFTGSLWRKLRDSRMRQMNLN